MHSLRLTQFLRPGEACHYAEVRIGREARHVLHTHDFHEVFWVTAGTGVHHINGTRRPLAPGSAALILPNDRHAFSSAGADGLLVSNFAFASRNWGDLCRRYLDAQQDPFAPHDAIEREYHLAGEGMAALGTAAEDLRSGRRAPIHCDRFLLNLIRIIESHASKSASAPLPAWLQSTCREIRRPERFRKGLSAFYILCGLSPEHVAREVRRHLGVTPTQIVNDARLDYAADRLATSADKIVAISMDAGFDNLGHFYTLFAARFKMTPRQYRVTRMAFIGQTGGVRSTSGSRPGL